MFRRGPMLRQCLRLRVNDGALLQPGCEGLDFLRYRVFARMPWLADYFTLPTDGSVGDNYRGDVHAVCLIR